MDKFHGHNMPDVLRDLNRSAGSCSGLVSRNKRTASIKDKQLVSMWNKSIEPRNAGWNKHLDWFALKKCLSSFFSNVPEDVIS